MTCSSCNPGPVFPNRNTVFSADRVANGEPVYLTCRDCGRKLGNPHEIAGYLITPPQGDVPQQFEFICADDFYLTPEAHS